MKFAAHSKGKIVASSQQLEQVILVLSRIETCLPHLIFLPWRASILQIVDNPIGEVCWKPKARVEISIILTDGLKLSTLCHRISGNVDKNDYDFLYGLANEAVVSLGSASEMPVPLIEFGSYSVADRIKELAGIDGDVYSTLMFVRSLVYETYENQRISYGVILCNNGSGAHTLSESFDNKRLKRLTDGFATALVLDEWQRIVNFVHLDVPEREGLLFKRRPWWCAALASKSKELCGTGVALTRNGDLIVICDGKLLFSQRAGRWQIWNHRAVLGTLRSKWLSSRNRGSENEVLGCLYHLAMDLSFKRSGGLLIILDSAAHLQGLLMSRIDALGSSRRGGGEQAIDQILSNKTVRQIDRRILADIASLDGALIVDRNGLILAYGAMTRPAASNYQGARAKAAVAASRHGLAIKISSDGNIGFFKDEENFLNI